MAGAMLRVDLDGEFAYRALERLGERLDDLHLPLSDIGTYLLLATDQRFSSQVSPDGTPWAPLSPVTLARKKGTRILRDTGELADGLRWQVAGNELAFGTDRPYGAVHQFGQKQGASGKNRRGSPIPWGDIPARPYLGLSNDDEAEIVRIVQTYLVGD